MGMIGLSLKTGDIGLQLTLEGQEIIHYSIGFDESTIHRPQNNKLMTYQEFNQWIGFDYLTEEGNINYSSN